MSVGDSIDRSVDLRPRACIRLSGALGLFFPRLGPITERREGGWVEEGGGGGAHTFTGVGLRAGIVLRWLDVRSSGVGGKKGGVVSTPATTIDLVYNLRLPTSR